MTGPDEDQYRVTPAAEGFEIHDNSGRCLVSFADKGSAEGLAVLLNQVYRKGYKDGYRAGKQHAQKA